MTRQYIGARYVPKFYEGSNGSQWESGVMYDPLTIVQHNTNTYCSKKTVPSTIGQPNLNPEYWANIGLLGDVTNILNQLQSDVSSLNDSVDSLDTRIDTNTDDINGINEDIDDLTLAVNSVSSSYFSTRVVNGVDMYFKNKRVCIIGDSISDENISWNPEIDDVWVKKFRNYFDSRVNVTITNLSRSSRGFKVSAGGKTIEEVVNELNYNDYDVFIIFAGVNDFLQGTPIGTYYDNNDTTFWSALRSIANKLRGTKPVFMVSPLPCGSGNSPFYGYTLQMYRAAIYTCCVMNGFHFINGTSIGGINYAFNWAADFLHVKNSFSYLLAQGITTAIIKGGETFNDKVCEIAEIKNVTWGNFSGNVNITTNGGDVEIELIGTLNGELDQGLTDLKTIPIARYRWEIDSNSNGDVMKINYYNAGNITPGGTIGIYGTITPGSNITARIIGRSYSLCAAKFYTTNLASA